MPQLEKSGSDDQPLQAEREANMDNQIMAFIKQLLARRAEDIEAKRETVPNAQGGALDIIHEGTKNKNDELERILSQM